MWTDGWTSSPPLSPQTAPPRLRFLLAHHPDYPPPTYVTREGLRVVGVVALGAGVRRGWSKLEASYAGQEGCRRGRDGELRKQLEGGDVLRTDEAEMASVKGADAGCAEALGDGDEAAIDAAEVLIGVLNGERGDSSPVGCR